MSEGASAFQDKKGMRKVVGCLLVFRRCFLNTVSFKYCFVIMQTVTIGLLASSLSKSVAGDEPVESTMVFTPIRPNTVLGR